MSKEPGALHPIVWSVFDPSNIAVENHSKRAGLQIADTVTSAYFLRWRHTQGGCLHSQMRTAQRLEIAHWSSRAARTPFPIRRTISSAPIIHPRAGPAFPRPSSNSFTVDLSARATVGPILTFHLAGRCRCQRRSKNSPPGRSKTSPLNVMRYAVLGGCPGSP